MLRYYFLQAPPPRADETVVELQSVPHVGRGRRRDHVTVAVVETPVQPQQQPNVMATDFGPPPTYDVIAPPAYVK